MILTGDCRAVLPTLDAESVDAVVTLRASLDYRVGSPMARAAKRDEVRQPVRLSVIHEQPKRADVMHVRSLLSTMPTRSLVPSPRAAALSLPVRTAKSRRATEKLRVQSSGPVLVATRTRAELPLPAHACRVARPSGELGSAAHACQRDAEMRPAPLGLVLACGRAGLPAPVLEARGRHAKRFPARLTGGYDEGSHAPSIGQGMPKPKPAPKKKTKAA